MKIVYNSLIPFKGFIAINMFGVLFVRNEYKEKITPTVINHEQIHTAQMKELLYVFFYIIYIFEYIVNLFRYMTPDEAYRNISFEREAYGNQSNMEYLLNRKPFGQWRKNKE